MADRNIPGNGAVKKLDAIASDITVRTVTPQDRAAAENPTLKRMRRTTYQARLGRKLDAISQKAIDNAIRLTANPTDMIRISVNRDGRSQDLISRTVESVEVMPIMLPVLKDIPLRHFLKEDTDIVVPSFYTIQEQEYFVAYAPIEADLNEDDLLIRMLYDNSKTDPDYTYSLVLQVKDVLGTFGYSSLVWKKIMVTFYDEALPYQIVNAVKLEIRKREALNW